MSERGYRVDSIDRRAIDLDSCTSPIILASLLGVKEPAIDKLRQKGYLHQSTQTPLAENLTFYITKLKQLATGKVGELNEQLVISNTKKNIAQTEKIYQQMAIDRGEYVELREILDLLTPIFYMVQADLHNIARDYPEVEEKIGGVLTTWNRLGVVIAEKANQEAETYVQSMLDKFDDAEDAREEIAELFGIILDE